MRSDLRWFLAILAFASLARADGEPRSADAKIQAAIDAADNGPWPHAADVPLAAGTFKLDRPLWLDRHGIRLVGHRGTRLQANGAFPAVIAGLKRVDRKWEAAHAVRVEGDDATRGAPSSPASRFVWDFQGDSCLVLRGTPFDLGPWAGKDIWNAQLTGWGAVRKFRVQIALQRDDPSWERQAILTLGREKPDPWRLFCPATGRLAFEATLDDGGRIYADWDAPEAAGLVLDLTADLDAGTLTVLQNGQAATMAHFEGFRPGLWLKRPEATEFCVARGIPSYYAHGRFRLHGLRITTDGKPLAELDPAPLGGGDGLWRWQQGDNYVWGFGLLRPAEWSNNGTIDAPALKDLTISCPNGWPYGVAVLLGLCYDFEADHCRFLSGARGLDQLRMDVCYVSRIHHARFFGQRDACINLDYGISTLDALTLSPRGARWAIRSRDNAMRICDIFIDPGESIASAVRLAESRGATIDRLMVDAEAPRTFPAHLVHASLGRNNGGATVLVIRDTLAAQTTDALVRLDDTWEGQGGSGVGPGSLRVENSFRTFLGKQTPALVRQDGAWSVEISGPTPEGVPQTLGSTESETRDAP